MDMFWVSNNGQVSPQPMARDVIQATFIDAGASLELPLMKTDEAEWKTAADYGFQASTPPSVEPVKPEEYNGVLSVGGLVSKVQEQPPEEKKPEYRAISPCIYLGEEKIVSYVFGKTESIRRERCEKIAKLFNDNNIVL